MEQTAKAKFGAWLAVAKLGAIAGGSVGNLAVLSLFTVAAGWWRMLAAVLAITSPLIGEAVALQLHVEGITDRGFRTAASSVVTLYGATIGVSIGDMAFREPGAAIGAVVGATVCFISFTRAVTRA